MQVKTEGMTLLPLSYFVNNIHLIESNIREQRWDECRKNINYLSFFTRIHLSESEKDKNPLMTVVNEILPIDPLIQLLRSELEKVTKEGLTSEGLKKLFFRSRLLKLEMYFFSFSIWLLTTSELAPNIDSPEVKMCLEIMGLKLVKSDLPIACKQSDSRFFSASTSKVIVDEYMHTLQLYNVLVSMLKPLDFSKLYGVFKVLYEESMGLTPAELATAITAAISRSSDEPNLWALAEINFIAPSLHLAIQQFSQLVMSYVDFYESPAATSIPGPSRST